MPDVPEFVCPNKKAHTTAPGDSIQYHAWAQRMSHTHIQTRCHGCGRYLIWLPKGQL